VIESGSGSYVSMMGGCKYLDFTCGIGVANLGHCHPGVTKAAQEQAGKLVHGQINIAFQKPYIELVEKLLPVMPHKSLDTFFFWNSGAEAVEAAIKLARHATKKQNIIAMQGSYHGRTFGEISSLHRS
jgi:4-aminobutyrate aminotransferase